MADAVKSNRPANVTGPLQGLVGRLRAYLLLNGAAYLLVAGLVVAIVQVLLDWLLRLEVEMRAAMLVAAVAAIGVVFWRWILSPLFGMPDAAGMAGLVERRLPGWDSLLVSGVRFSAGDVGPASANSPELVDAVVAATAERLRGASLDGVLNHRRARRCGYVAAGVPVLFVVALIAAPQTVGIWFDRSVMLGNTPWPQRTQIIVESDHGVIRGARGDDIEIRAAVREGFVAPRQMKIAYTTPDGDRAWEPMTRIGERGYRFVFPELEQELAFYVEGGDDRTSVFQVQLVDRPAVNQLAIRVNPPAYTHAAGYDMAEGRRAIEVLPGTALMLRFASNKPVVSASVMQGDTVLAESTAGSDRRAWEATFVPADTMTFHLRLIDDEGLENKRPDRYHARVIQDRPPAVSMKAPGVGGMITPRAVMPMEVEIQDEFGIAAGVLVHTLAREGDVEHEAPLPSFGPGPSRYAERFDVAVESFGVMLDDHLTVHVRAADFDDVSGPNVGQSSAIAVRVVSDEELLSEIARREQACRRDFQRAYDAQENLRREWLSISSGIDAASTGASGAGMRGRIASAERTQRQIAGRVDSVARRYEQVLAELVINRLDDGEIRQRVEQGVVRPLSRLARRDLIEAADMIRHSTDEPTAASAVEIDRRQAEILRSMQAILAQMLQWEGFQETVTMLREIIRLQEALREETIEEIERQAEDVFE